LLLSLSALLLLFTPLPLLITLALTSPLVALRTKSFSRLASSTRKLS